MLFRRSKNTFWQSFWRTFFLEMDEINSSPDSSSVSVFNKISKTIPCMHKGNPTIKNKCKFGWKAELPHTGRASPSCEVSATSASLLSSLFPSLATLAGSRPLIYSKDQ